MMLGEKQLTIKRFRQAEVGTLESSMQAFDVRSAPGQTLVVYDAHPGSASADALALLGSLVVARGRAPQV